MSWNEIYDALASGVKSTSVSGWLATVTALFYVVLAAKENIWCWPFGIASSAFSVMLYLESELPFEALLNVIYCIVGVYGWWQWRSKKPDKKETAGAETKSPVINLDYRTGLILLLIGTAGSVICGWISWHFKTSALPWTDAAIASFSIVATWMTAKKIIENWLLWIVLDAVAAVIYFIKGPSLYLFALLFILYTFIAFAGYLSWKKIQKQQSKE